MKKHNTKIIISDDVENTMFPILSFDSEKMFVNPTINRILTIGIDRLSDPLALVISAMVAPIAVKSVNKNIKLVG